MQLKAYPKQRSKHNRHPNSSRKHPMKMLKQILRVQNNKKRQKKKRKKKKNPIENKKKNKNNCKRKNKNKSNCVKRNRRRRLSCLSQLWTLATSVPNLHPSNLLSQAKMTNRNKLHHLTRINHKTTTSPRETLSRLNRKPIHQMLKDLMNFKSYRINRHSNQNQVKIKQKKQKQQFMINQVTKMVMMTRCWKLLRKTLRLQNKKDKQPQQLLSKLKNPSINFILNKRVVKEKKHQKKMMMIKVI